jgi:hypothetical protein
MSGNTNGLQPYADVPPSVEGIAPTEHAATPEFAFDSMTDALAAFKAGQFLLVMDDEGRENEGDLITAADSITTEKMAWFIRVTRWVSFSVAFTAVALALRCTLRLKDFN